MFTELRHRPVVGVGSACLNVSAEHYAIQKIYTKLGFMFHNYINLGTRVSVTM